MTKPTRTARLVLVTFGLQTLSSPSSAGTGPQDEQRAFDGPVAVATTAVPQLWPPNHAFQDVGLRVVASDPSGTPPAAVVQVWSDERDDAGPPVHTPDTHLTAGALELRSERLGGGDGRVYLLIARVNGASGATHACATVTVPHSQSQAAIALVNAQAAAARTQCAAYASAPPGYVLLAQGPFGVANPSLALVPMVECVQSLPGGGREAVFGYYNPNPVPVVVALGADNRFDPAPPDRGQPSAFLSGRSPTAQGAFRVPFSGTVSWRLQGRLATASATSPACAAAPATPDARDDEASTEAATPVSIAVLQNDSDPQGDPLRVVRVGAPAHGTATFDA
ncbi:MAG TPA: Ig-like domain-containing protein, partial [Vicinamibacteria bacterium]|nr:Ig-like domain-containing protein [Vicinamibacteria bacterium]